MKQKSIIIALSAMLICFSSFSQITKKTDIQTLRTVDRLRPSGSISGSICNPHFKGLAYVDIQHDYNIAVYEAKKMANGNFAMINYRTDGFAISAINFEIDQTPADTFKYRITNLPLHTNLILVFYNKFGNKDEALIKADEQKYKIAGAYFSNTRDPRIIKDYTYPIQPGFAFTCTVTNLDFINHEIDVLKANTISIPK